MLFLMRLVHTGMAIGLYTIMRSIIVCISLYLFNTSPSIPLFILYVCLCRWGWIDSVDSLSPSLYSSALVKHAPFVEKKCTIDIYARKGKVWLETTLLFIIIYYFLLKSFTLSAFASDKILSWLTPCVDNVRSLEEVVS